MNRIYDTNVLIAKNRADASINRTTEILNDAEISRLSKNSGYEGDEAYKKYAAESKEYMKFWILQNQSFFNIVQKMIDDKLIDENKAKKMYEEALHTAREIGITMQNKNISLSDIDEMGVPWGINSICFTSIEDADIEDIKKINKRRLKHG